MFIESKLMDGKIIFINLNKVQEIVETSNEALTSDIHYYGHKNSFTVDESIESIAKSVGITQRKFHACHKGKLQDHS